MLHSRFIFLALLTIAMPAFGQLQAQNQISLEMIEHLANFELSELGNPQIKSDAIPPVFSTTENPHRMLIIPVSYANKGFDRFLGESFADNKNQAYFDELLFDNDLHNPQPGTLTHYYYHQSKGQFMVSGEIFPMVTVDQPSEYYGSPVQNSDGQWRNDSRAEILVEDALVKAYEQQPDFPWEDFDVWDPMDYDGDGIYNERDGYIDHFVLVFAGKGQSSCQSLYSLNQKFTPNAPSNLYEELSLEEQECAQRIWPHRFSLTKNNGKGPEVESYINRRGGVELKEGLWVYDYNMQSEYTEVSTFIHEFGHSIGLPDVYARQTSNSTASWEVMSSTASPVPQEMSIWSRMVLGWAKPCVIEPTMDGGSKIQSLYLKTMNDWSGAANSEGVCDAAMVILPPKIRELRMGPLALNNGLQAAYTGQGNDLNNYLSRHFDLSDLADQEIIMELDAWFAIEADWDYLYIEASIDEENYQRLTPIDKSTLGDTDSVMPSQRGHDGFGTIPGFTGRSGDLDGDGKVESSLGCMPDQDVALAEDRVAEDAVDPCSIPQWIHAAFDLSAYAGAAQLEIRFHYYADMAAVEDGALIDNVEIAVLGFSDDFEAQTFQGWSVDGFSLSTGEHDLAVPHFYLLEYRDPYQEFATAYNYDSALAQPGFSFYKNAESGELEAVDFAYRSGVLLWYYNGSYLWSQNEPAQFGPGNGFLLLVDSTAQEFEVPLVPPSYFKEEDGWRFFELNEDVQPMLRESYLDVMCFQRRENYFPVDLNRTDRQQCNVADPPPGESLNWEGRPFRYSFTLINEVLPGADRQLYKSMGSLYDIRLQREGLSYRLYDRVLRNVHSGDAPFALEKFDDGLRFYRIENDTIMLDRVSAFSAVDSFSDSESYMNPMLQFGSANIPNEGLNFQLAVPDATAPAEAEVKVYFTWER